MESSKAKVLHEILGRPMIMYVLETAQQIAGKDIIIVVGNQAEAVRKVVSKKADVFFAFQEKQLGTGHATLCALPQVPEYIEDVVILCGDVPLITPATIERLLNYHLMKKKQITILAVEIDNPKGYGRILFDKKKNITGIVEEADATDLQKKITLVNSGIYCVKKDILSFLLKRVTQSNTQGELYLTDIIEIGCKKKNIIGAMVCYDREEVIGVNDVKALGEVESIMRNRKVKTNSLTFG